ncbi:cysteine-rich with EGF-like domain protein 2 isoform X2 [Ornithodoros turicata]|uniref:cysteine-rich with EGF-like domain protein 2 isoform X2 n=1 Tax=Ornithodoros turicata TaxID=34597 RepID=UPI003138B66E
MALNYIPLCTCLFFLFGFTLCYFDIEDLEGMEGMENVRIARSIDISDLGEKVARKDLLPPCQACKTIVKTFMHGMEQTKRNKFDGGDVEWEKRNMGKYSNSEIRFIEIQENLCAEVIQGQEHCRNLAEQHESYLEDWYFNKQQEEPDLHKFLCINEKKVCCPENHYGPNCEPCTGGAEKPCSGHGKCKGGGTRKGSGKCNCNTGYMGLLCDECTEGYHKSTSTSGESECLKCHKACKGNCTEGGPKACQACNDGYVMTQEFGCVDVDECIESETPVCKDGTFCVNSEGSHDCFGCDRACASCTGDGPDMCVKCADGYILKDKMCIEEKLWWREMHVLVARYSTYLGLCIATFIIFKRNAYVASVIGLLVAVYIGFSEYTLSGWESHQVTALLRQFFLW